ncbi:MAG: Lrp/AsnC family transcriptional regulator [Thaumarchaeota archaeon]|nr:Lrp/AsnC family transcriptional regulator [Nitrososphaerota archaeon]MCL5672274.1 Lrp/AsnC family transcriptional regulator [Nitrososphaerota archaeon]
MARLDELDMKILSSLHADASVSVPRLSKELGINLSVLYSRIKRLQKRGVIERFTVQVNEDMLGMQAGALAGLNIDPKLRESILNEVEKAEGVRLVREVTGRFDVIVNLRGKSLDELHRAVYDVIGKIPGVMHTEVFMEVSRRYPPVSFRLIE